MTQSSVLNYRDWNYKYIFYFNCLRLFWRVSLVHGVWLIYMRPGSGPGFCGAGPAHSPSPRVKTTRTLHGGTLIPALVASSSSTPGENPLPTAPQVRPRRGAWGRGTGVDSCPVGCSRGTCLHLRALLGRLQARSELRPHQVLFCSRRVAWEDVPGGTCRQSQHWGRLCPAWW